MEHFLITLELMRGQLENVHNQLERMFLRRARLVPSSDPPISKEKPKVIESSPWRDGESRFIDIAVLFTCIDREKGIFAVEELTTLESICVSLKQSLEKIMNISTPFVEGE